MKAVFSLLFAVAACAQTSSVSPDTVVLTVHGRTFTRAQFEAILADQKANPADLAVRLATANGLARAQTLAQEARNRKLDQLPAIRAKLENYTASLLASALFDDFLKEIHADESIARKYFATHPHLAEERQLRQILVRHTGSKPAAGKLTPEQALRNVQDLRAKLVAGAKFADLAMSQSDDEATKSKGGDMGFRAKPLLVPEFGEVAFQMKQGEISQPVKTTYGYHLILLEKIAPPEFAAVRKAIEYDIARQRVQAFAATAVQMNSEYFGQ